MIRISIRWFQLDAFACRATVTIYNSALNTFIGEWNVEVDGENLRTRHFPQPPDRGLPRAHEEYHHEVTSLIHAYLAGFHHKEEVHKWLEKPEIKKVGFNPNNKFNIKV